MRVQVVLSAVGAGFLLATVAACDAAHSGGSSNMTSARQPSGISVSAVQQPAHSNVSAAPGQPPQQPPSTQAAHQVQTPAPPPPVTQTHGAPSGQSGNAPLQPQNGDLITCGNPRAMCPEG